MKSHTSCGLLWCSELITWISDHWVNFFSGASENFSQHPRLLLRWLLSLALWCISNHWLTQGVSLLVSPSRNISMGTRFTAPQVKLIYMKSESESYTPALIVLIKFLVLQRDETVTKRMKVPDEEEKRVAVIRSRRCVQAYHCDIIGEQFWEEHPDILEDDNCWQLLSSWRTMTHKSVWPGWFKWTHISSNYCYG